MSLTTERLCNIKSLESINFQWKDIQKAFQLIQYVNAHVKWYLRLELEHLSMKCDTHEKCSHWFSDTEQMSSMIWFSPKIQFKCISIPS